MWTNKLPSTMPQINWDMATTEEIWLIGISRISGKNIMFYKKPLYNIYERKHKKSRKKCYKKQAENLCNILRDFSFFFTYIFMGSLRFFVEVLLVELIGISETV